MLFLEPTVPLFGQDSKNPFLIQDDPDTFEPNTTSIKVANRWLTPEMIAALNEESLGVDIGFRGIRVFINLGSEAPIVIRHQGMINDGKSLIEMKQIKKVNGKWSIVRQQTVDISEIQLKLIRQFFDSSAPYSLPVSDWADQFSLGGSAWVYEFPVPEGHYILVRANPLGRRPGVDLQLPSDALTSNRLSKEIHLATYVSLLCLASGWDVDFSYE